jgi:hypothetical protein
MNALLDQQVSGQGQTQERKGSDSDGFPKIQMQSKPGVELSTLRSLISYQFKGDCPIVQLLISVPIHVGGIQGQGCLNEVEFYCDTDDRFLPGQI